MNERALDVLGLRLRELLTERGWSQAEFARRLGKSQAWISQVVTGTRGVSLANVDEMADCFGVPVASLFSPDIQHVPSKEGSVAQQTPEARRVDEQDLRAAVDAAEDLTARLFDLYRQSVGETGHRRTTQQRTHRPPGRKRAR